MLLLLFALLSVQTGTAFLDCNVTQNITAFPFFLPFDTLLPQPYNFTGNCSQWRFEITEGQYATIIVNARFDNSDRFQISNSIGYSKTYNGSQSSGNTISQTVSSTYFFPANADTRISIQRQLGSTGALSFRIDMHDISGDFNHLDFNVTSEFDSIEPLSKFTEMEYRIGVPEGEPNLMLSLAVAQEDSRTDSCFVFLGPSCKEGTFENGLGYLQGQFSSYSTDVAICCFSPNLPEAYLIMAAQPDFMNDSRTASWISRISTDLVVPLDLIGQERNILDAANTVQYVTTYCPNGCTEYLNSAAPIFSPQTTPTQDSATFGIYAGFPSIKRWNKLSEQPLAQMSTWLPQEVRGQYRTYAIRQGDATLTVSTNSTQWSQMSNDRKGFFMTANYPFQQWNQNASSTIFATEDTHFLINGNDANVNMGVMGSLNISTDTDSKLALPATGNFTLVGSQITFNAVQRDTTASGGILFFEIVAKVLPGGVKNVVQFPYSWPYNDVKPLPYSFPNNTYQWKFAVPVQKFAAITVNGKFGDDDTFEIRNSKGLSYSFNKKSLSNNIPQTVKNTYVFPADPSTTISITTGRDFNSTAGELSFTVNLTDVPSSSVESNVVTLSTAFVVPFKTLATKEYQLKQQMGSPKVMLSVASDGLSDPRTDSCFVYTGPSCRDGTFAIAASALTTDFSIQSNDIAVCCFSQDIPNYYLIVAAQFDDMQPGDRWISRISGNNTVSLNAITSEGLNSSVTQYLTTYFPEGSAEYLESAEGIRSNTTDSTNSTSVGIYAGFPSPIHWVPLNEVPLNQVGSWLPQQVLGESRTYVARNGDVKFTLSNDNTKFATLTQERNGFFMTPNFRFLSSNQNANTTINSPNGPAVFTFKGDQIVNNLGNGGSLFVTGDNQQRLVFPFSGNSGNQSLTASSLTFTSVQTVPQSTGAIVFFNAVPPPEKSSSSTVLFTSLVSFLLVLNL